MASTALGQVSYKGVTSSQWWLKKNQTTTREAIVTSRLLQLSDETKTRTRSENKTFNSCYLYTVHENEVTISEEQNS